MHSAMKADFQNACKPSEQQVVEINSGDDSAKCVQWMLNHLLGMLLLGFCCRLLSCCCLAVNEAQAHVAVT